MQPMMDEEAPMMEAAEEKPMSEKPASELDPETYETRHESLDMCCCCICQCQEKEVRDLSCCGCFPIKCGVVSIGVYTLVLAVLLGVEIFYTLLNEYVEWWYVVVAIVLLIPLFVATAYYVAFFSKDTEATRTLAFAGCMQVIISVSLLAIWNTVYFLAFYKKPLIYFGNTEFGYLVFTKRQYFFWLYLFTAVVDFSYMYFICVTSTYSERLKEKKPDPEMMAMMEEMMEKMMEDKMSEMMEEKMGEMMEAAAEE